MKLVVFGATGKTGIELVIQALDRGHSVTAFVRDPDRLSIEDKRLRFVTGDIFDPAAEALTVKGQDAIICALGAGSDLKKRLSAQPAQSILSANYLYLSNQAKSPSYSIVLLW